MRPATRTRTGFAASHSSVPRRVGRVQVGRERVAPEVVREGDARLAQARELRAALGDQRVLVRGRLLVVSFMVESLQSLLQARFHERVERPVEHGLRDCRSRGRSGGP